MVESPPFPTFTADIPTFTAYFYASFLPHLPNLPTFGQKLPIFGLERIDPPGFTEGDLRSALLPLCREILGSALQMPGRKRRFPGESWEISWDCIKNMFVGV
jgi:hypothetical protein